MFVTKEALDRQNGYTSTRALMHQLKPNGAPASSLGQNGEIPLFVHTNQDMLSPRFDLDADDRIGVAGVDYGRILVS